MKCYVGKFKCIKETSNVTVEVNILFNKIKYEFMKTITISKLKKALSKKSEKELIEEIIGLFKKFPQVKEYYTLTFSNEGEEHVLEKYKEIITNAGLMPATQNKMIFYHRDHREITC